MTAIRCRDKKHRPREPWAKFKCTKCKTWVCSHCEGTHSDTDPVGNGLCDRCWAKRDKRVDNHGRGPVVSPA